MTTVGDLLHAKGHHIWTVTPETSVYDALAVLSEHDIGAVLVVNAVGEMLGIFSERDYARKVVLKGQFSRDISVASVMTEEVFCVNPSIPIETCMALMTQKRVRHLPVRDAHGLAGVVSLGDVGKALIAEKEFLIEQLEHYICGDR
jgi:CBS domain-containing protein